MPESIKPIIQYKTATPTIISGVAYADNEHLGSVMTIETGQNQFVELKTIAITDRALQSAPINLLFFNTLPVLTSLDGAAFSIVDAEMEKLAGKVTIVAADYQTSLLASGGSVNTLLKIDTDTDGKFYVQAVSKGTPTYTSTTDLQFKFAVEEQ